MLTHICSETSPVVFSISVALPSGALRAGSVHF